MKKNKNYFVILSEAKNLAFGDSGWGIEECALYSKGWEYPLRHYPLQDKIKRTKTIKAIASLRSQ